MMCGLNLEVTDKEMSVILEAAALYVNGVLMYWTTMMKRKGSGLAERNLDCAVALY
jgi:hypothetical protein